MIHFMNVYAPLFHKIFILKFLKLNLHPAAIPVNTQIRVFSVDKKLVKSLGTWTFLTKYLINRNKIIYVPGQYRESD